MHNIDNTGARWEPMDLQINTDEENDNIYIRMISFSFDTICLLKMGIVKA